MKVEHEAFFMNIANDIPIHNKGHLHGDSYGMRLPYEKHKTLLQHLVDYGVLGVRTVNEIGWRDYGDRKYYWVWITPTGEAFLRGEVEPEKPCNKDTGTYWSAKCKRRNVNHYRESF